MTGPWASQFSDIIFLSKDEDVVQIQRSQFLRDQGKSTVDDVQNDEHWFGLILWQGNNPFRLGIQGLGFRETSIQHLLPDGGSTFHGLGADNIVLFLWADLQTKVSAAVQVCDLVSKYECHPVISHGRSVSSVMMSFSVRCLWLVDNLAIFLSTSLRASPMMPNMREIVRQTSRPFDIEHVRLKCGVSELHHIRDPYPTAGFSIQQPLADADGVTNLANLNPS